MTEERKNELYEKMIEWICEHISDSEDLFYTLHKHLWMTQEELHENSIESLDDLFRNEEQSAFSSLENKGVTLSDFIEKVSEMVNGRDKTAVLNWIEFADFLTDCSEPKETTLEKELGEIYLPLCYVKNNFSNDILQMCLQTQFLGNEIIFAAMLYDLGCTEAQVRKLCNEGELECGYIPQTDDEKQSISLVYADDGNKILYMVKDKETNTLEYMKKVAEIIKERGMEVNQTLAHPMLCGKMLRQIDNELLAEAIEKAMKSSTAFKDIIMYSANENTVCRYSANELPEDFKINIVVKKNQSETFDFSMQ